MPTTVHLIEGVWVISGPWGQREIVHFPNQNTPTRRLASELGMSHLTTVAEVEAVLVNKSWDWDKDRWVDDPP